jgi:hypothetical protein
MATVADIEADLLIALRAIAGVQSGGDFRIRDGDVSFDVDYVGGSSSRLTLEVASLVIGYGGRWVAYDRPSGVSAVAMRFSRATSARARRRLASRPCGADTAGR